MAKFGRLDLVVKLTEHEEHRGSIDTISRLFAAHGLNVGRCFQDLFEMKFLNGTAFLNQNDNAVMAQPVTN